MIFDKKKKNFEISKIFYFKNKIIYCNIDSFFLKVGFYGWNLGCLCMFIIIMVEVYVCRFLFY